jgi:dihydroorotase
MQELSAVPFGMSSLDTALSQVITYLIKPGKLDWKRAIECLSCAPADVLGIEAGSLEVGKPADVVLIDPTAAWTVERSEMFSRNSNTPLLGKQLEGRVAMVWVGGRRKFNRH